MLVNSIIIFIYMYNITKKGRISKLTFYFILTIFTLSILTIFHYNSLHDILRLLIMFSSFAIFFLSIERINKLFVDKYIFLIYLILFIAEITNIYLLNMPERDSIFNGGENIPIVIFLLLATYLFFSNTLTKYHKSLVGILYLMLIYSTDSRSVLIILITLTGLLVFKILLRYNKFIILFLLLFVSIILTTVTININADYNDSRILSLIRDIEKVDLSNIYEYEKIDIRGLIYIEALDKISNAPLVGSGVVTPIVIKEEFGDKGMSSFHSSLFDVLVTYGFFGLIAIVVFFSYLFKKLIANNREKLFFYIFIIVPFVVLSLIQPYFFNLQIISLLYVLLFIGSRENQTGENIE